MQTFHVTLLEDNEYKAVTTTNQPDYRLVVGPQDPLFLTPNAAVTTGCFMNSAGIIYKTTKAKIVAAWDDNEFLYIQVRGGYIHKFSLRSGRKIQV